MTIKDAFELFIKILDRDRAQFMQDPPHFLAGVGVGIRAILGL